MTVAAFDSRIARLVRKHRTLAAGGVAYHLTRDGLILAHPRRRLAPAFPLRALLLLLVGALAFKALLLGTLGDAAYGERLATLRQGSPVERAGAWLMQADPATVAVVGALRDLTD